MNQKGIMIIYYYHLKLIDVKKECFIIEASKNNRLGGQFKVQD